MKKSNIFWQGDYGNRGTKLGALGVKLFEQAYLRQNFSGIDCPLFIRNYSVIYTGDFFVIGQISYRLTPLKIV